MNRFALISIIALALASSAVATPTCVGGTYAQFEALAGGCVINNLLFDHFGFSNSADPAGIAIPATAIGVTLITTPGNEGFKFNPSGMTVQTQTGGNASSQDVHLTFHVTVLSGPGINSLHLGFEGNFTGTGMTNVNEQYCSSPCPTGALGSPFAVTNPPPVFNADASFAARNDLWISKDIAVTSGINGTAFLSAISNTYAHVPEPMTLALLGSGLVGIGVLRRKRKI